VIVAEAVLVTVGVCVFVYVLLGGVGVYDGVDVGVYVGVRVGVEVGVYVLVGVPVIVNVGVGVDV
jgi:hypothetical protein